MPFRKATTILASVLLVAAAGGSQAQSIASLDAVSFQTLPEKPSGRTEPEVARAEVLLARAGFSPGSIDGHDGDNFRRALAAFRKREGLPTAVTLDQAMWDRLSVDKASVVARYPVTSADVRGPYVRKIPAEFEKQSRLKRLGFHDIREMLAERFHMSPMLLDALNPRSRFRAGDTIEVVAAVGAAPTAKAASVVVDKAGQAVAAFGPDGALLAFFPASIGSEEKPAPTGRFEITRIAHHPDYTYLPRYHFKGVSAKQPFTIAPGPNNPVGTVWMDLSYEGYGIHGTPEPELVGKTQSHGCIRLTNWDADFLASLVEPGTPVTFQDGADNPISPAPQPVPGTAPPPGPQASPAAAIIAPSPAEAAAKPMR